MKPKQQLTRLLVAGMLMAGFAGLSYAQTTNYLVDQFNTDTTSSLVNLHYGTASPVLTWDTNQNATTSMGPNTAGSGAIQWVIAWPTNNDQVAVRRFFNNGNVLNLTLYTNISFDIKFDPSSATDGFGSYGAVEVDWIPQSDGWPSTANTPQAYATFTSANNGWQHVSLALSASSIPKLSTVTGLAFKIQQNKTGQNLTGTTTFWIDNVILGALNQVLHPVMSLRQLKSAPGLTMVAPGGGNQFIRTLLMAVDSVNGVQNFSWVGSGSTPVTYSTSIAAYPDTNHTFFQSVIFLVPNGGGGNPAIDYTAPNVAQLVVMNRADGTATGSFQYKTNQPNGNSQYVGSGNLATITCPSPLGTWSLTFLNDTNITMTGPGNISTNFNLPDAATAQIFANPLTAYFGNQQNGANNSGQFSTYTEFAIKGVTASPEIDEVFTNETSINTASWSVDSATPGDTFILQPTDKYWVSWTIPDTGFGFQVSTNLSDWIDPGVNNLITTERARAVVLPSMTDSLPTSDPMYFRLMK